MDGILIISFGTSYRESREKTVYAFMETFEKAFPEIPVYLAFTSRAILKKIYEEEGICIDAAEEALKRMYTEGITRVFIQPAYIFHELEKDGMPCIDQYKELFPGGVYIGAPLLKDEEDYRRVFSVLFKELSAGRMEDGNVSRETLDDAAVILIGHAYHGNSNDDNNDNNGNTPYPLNRYRIEGTGYKNIYAGAAEGYPDADAILSMLQEKKNIKRVILVPFFFLIGKHALKDIAGSGQSSWKSRFQQAGYQVELFMKGMGEYPEIRARYVQHLLQVIYKENQGKFFE